MIFSIPPEMAEQFTQDIISCGEQAASALVHLVYAIADPQGDPHRYQLALTTIRTAIPFVSEYDAMCREYCERGTAQDETKSVSAS